MLATNGKNKIQCNNHTCAQPLKDGQSYTTCMLCREPKYCSQQCYQMDRTLHACEHEIDVNAPLTERGFAVPYYFEDYLTSEDVKGLDPSNVVFSSYSIRHAAPNRVITQTLVPPLVSITGNAQSKDNMAPVSRGRKPDVNLEKAGEYAIRITHRSYQPDAQPQTTWWRGTIPKDMIFAGNRANAKADKLASRVYRGVTATSNHYIFWPQQQSVLNPITMDDRSSIDVDLFIKHPGETQFRAEPDAYVHAGFHAQNTKGGVFAAGRRVQEMFRSQLKKKFENIPNISLEDLHVRRYGYAGQNGIILTFQKFPNSSSVRLVDIEFLVPAMDLKLGVVTPAVPERDDDVSYAAAGLQSKPSPIITDVYKCDPRNFQDVTGLVMSISSLLTLQDAILPLKESTALKKCETILTKYAHEMEENNGVSPHTFVPTSVQAAVGSAMDMTYEHIGVQLNIDYYTKKILGSYESVVEIADKLIAEMESGRTSAKEKKGIFKLGGKAKKSKALRSLQNFSTALGSFISRLERPDMRDQNQEVIQKYQELRSRVEQAKNA